MQAQGSEANAAAGAALRMQQMAGERLVNQCRFGLTAFGALTILTASGAQTKAANAVFVGVVCVLASYASLVWFWLRKAHRHERTLKYVSVWVDISCLYALHVASLVNHSGVYEVFRAPGTWLMIGVFNGLGAVRYSARASLFSASLTVLYGGVLLFIVRRVNTVPWVDQSTFIGTGLNIFDCAIAVVFAAVPAVCWGQGANWNPARHLRSGRRRFKARATCGRFTRGLTIRPPSPCWRECRVPETAAA